MSGDLNHQRQLIVGRYTETTLEVLNKPEVVDGLGEQQSELVALVSTSFTVQRRFGSLVVPLAQLTQNNVGIHPVVERDLTIPSPDRLLSSPTSAEQRPAHGSLLSRVAGAIPIIFDKKTGPYASTMKGKESRRDLIILYPRLRQVSRLQAAVVIAHEFDHVRSNRELDRNGTPLSHDDRAQLVAGEKAAYKVSEAILEASNLSLPLINFEMFWSVIKSASTPAAAAEQAVALTRRLVHHTGSLPLGELAANVYIAKALSLRFGEINGPPTPEEVEAYKLFGLIHG
jgi:hypothetical protein